MLAPRVAFILLLTLAAPIPLYAQATVAELNDAGWKALETGNSRRAATLFGEALTLRPDDAVLLTGSAAALYLEGRAGEAITRLKRAVKLQPTLMQASILLGRIAYDEGDVDLAITTYERLLARTDQLAQREALENALMTLRAWKL